MSDQVVVALRDEGLGNTSYLVDLGNGDALSVDPSRDLRALRRAARERGLRVAVVAETHLHADFLSGAVQLAADDGARIVASAAGDREFLHQGLHDEEEVDLGGLTLRALTTPGHTGEHLSYELRDGARTLRSGLRPELFLVGIAYAALGLGLSALVVRETRGLAAQEAMLPEHTAAADGLVERVPTDREVFVRTSLREPALSAASQAGLVNNLNDGLAWGLFPVLFASAGLGGGGDRPAGRALSAVWGLGQLLTGALSDHWGRKGVIVAGMLVQAGALALTAAADRALPWAVAAVLLGAGTAMVYPTLLAAIGDVAHPSWRARAIGTYRLWRDAGFAVGALLAGVLADLWGVRGAVWVVAGITAASGLVVGVRMYETHDRLA